MGFYTGIGSRATPDAIQSVMAKIAFRLAHAGWTLRSGCATGADSAFEFGAWQAIMRDENAAPRPQLFLPWPGFSSRAAVAVTLEKPQPEAYRIAEQFHPNWASLKNGAKALHARNTHQLLGPDVTNPVLSSFVICWTPNAEGGGGTGQALRIARHYEVPIFDLASAKQLQRLQRFVEGE